ncbi:MAG TPA: NAD(P)/FAD-dependent oxidoreductase [Patescibacteria group bacterium]|nr:NAD(P)/FAD-dependent oxidoreductase [Patescibacteria group bacterium]
MEQFDVIIVGASFSGLTLGHHLPNNLRVLILDRKTKVEMSIETTGLVTQATHDLLASFVDVDTYIPNKITTIGVISPSYDKYFFSHTDKPWIYSTDTPMLVKHMADTLPQHVELRLGAGLLSYEQKESSEYPIEMTYLHGGEKKQVQAKFLVGADGSHSTVAKLNSNLSKNKRFLAGFEKVFYGDITLGDHPENTIYHFWFGEFSIGYGGWLSPTIINGKKAFRLGLAKLEKDAKDLKKIDQFIAILLEKKIIRIEGDPSKAILAFGHLIPIGGVLPNVTDKNILLIGDAAGFCGAFAADGIKGSVVSGKVAGELIPRYLGGEKAVLQEYHAKVQLYNKLMTYYKKQILYRFLWDRMRSDRSFHILFDLIAREKDSFLYQFCDSKDKHKSLMRVVLKLKNIPKLVQYTASLFLDLFKK